MVTIEVSELLRVIVKGDGAGADKDTDSGADPPSVTGVLEGNTTLPALWTVAVAVTSGMNGVRLAWITAVPKATAVTGTDALIAEGAKVTVAGTVATEAADELKFTVSPPLGAGDDRFSVTFCVCVPRMVNDV